MSERTTPLALSAALVLGLAVGACSASESDAAMDEDSEPRVMMTQAEVEAAMDELRNEWVSSWEMDDATAVAGFYTDDAMFLGLDGVKAEGRAGIEAMLSEQVPMMSGLSVTRESLDMIGDVVVMTGAWSLTMMSADGTEAPMGGNYMTVATMTDAGYKITHHMSQVPVDVGGDDGM